LVIEKGELHQIKNSGRRPLVTINWYVPPAYDAGGEPR
jgi:oxalate decarboxylase/phosphoglucose isomerase-like protein (cupin superfamily)